MTELLFFFFFVMIRRPPVSTRTYTLFPYTTLFRSMVGSSYDGFTAAMALFDPHPALKVIAPYSPMVDGWIGDDWFSYGAFRQVMFSYFTGQMTRRGRGVPIASTGYDDYTTLLDRKSTRLNSSH